MLRRLNALHTRSGLCLAKLESCTGYAYRLEGSTAPDVDVIQYQAGCPVLSVSWSSGSSDLLGLACADFTVKVGLKIYCMLFAVRCLKPTHFILI